MRDGSKAEEKSLYIIWRFWWCTALDPNLPCLVL